MAVGALSRGPGHRPLCQFRYASRCASAVGSYRYRSIEGVSRAGGRRGGSRGDDRRLPFWGLFQVRGQGVACPAVRRKRRRARLPAPLPARLTARATQARADRGAALLFTLRKGPEARWLGHLDLLRVIDRAVRMSRIDVVYTQGFNPRPKMSIASALPLGATADADLFTIHLARPVDPEAVRESFNSCLPPGVEMSTGAFFPIIVKGPSRPPASFLSGRAGTMSLATELFEAARRLMGEGSIPVERESGGQTKEHRYQAGDRVAGSDRR